MPVQAIYSPCKISSCPERSASLSGSFVIDAGAAVPRGVQTLNFHYDKDGDSRRKSEHLPENGSESAPKSKKPASPGVGHALRSVYQQTVNEDIPPEMLDLLGKLG